MQIDQIFIAVTCLIDVVAVVSAFDKAVDKWKNGIALKSVNFRRSSAF